MPVLLPEITLPAPAAVPPTIVPGKLLMLMPIAFPTARSPAAFTPMRLPWMTFAFELVTMLLAILIPAPVLPEMTLPAVGRRPADGVAGGVGVDRDADAIEDCRRAGGVEADVVVPDHGARSIGPDLDSRAVSGDDVPCSARATDDRALGADDVETDRPLGIRTAPEGSVPMKLPWTTLSFAAAPFTLIRCRCCPRRRSPHLPPSRRSCCRWRR